MTIGHMKPFRLIFFSICKSILSFTFHDADRYCLLLDVKGAAFPSIRRMCMRHTKYTTALADLPTI